MPVILKKCFLFHYDPSINSDKVFNLFLIDNQNGTYSAISEFGRSGTKLNVKPLIENCSLPVAQGRYAAKLNEKIYHPRTPYTHTLNASTSPTFQRLGAVPAGQAPAKAHKGGKVFDFKPLSTDIDLTKQSENKSGGQDTDKEGVKQGKRIGVLNLDALDALEI